MKNTLCGCKTVKNLVLNHRSLLIEIFNSDEILNPFFRMKNEHQNEK